MDRSKFELNRRQFLTVTSASLADAPSSAATRSARPPNIVFIYADDLDFDELGPYEADHFPCHTAARLAGVLHPLRQGAAYADPRMLTPYLDQLAREGMTFSRFYVTSAICTPSRYSLMTGRYASRSAPFCRRYPPGTPATILWDTNLDPEETSLPRALKQAGYRVGFVGKWHLGVPGGYRVQGVDPDADPFDSRVNRTIEQT